MNVHVPHFFSCAYPLQLSYLSRFSARSNPMIHLMSQFRKLYSLAHCLCLCGMPVKYCHAVGDIMFPFQSFVCLSAILVGAWGLNCSDLDDWRSRHGGWHVGPDRYYKLGGYTKYHKWEQAEDSCGNYFEDSQLAVPHSGDDVHFIREQVMRPSNPLFSLDWCVWVGKLTMTT